MANEEIVAIASDADIVTARQRGRAVAAQVGFSSIDLALIATAISELARNIVLYAGRGEIRVALVQDHGRPGVRVVATDSGPGIPNLERAMQGGYSTSGSLGLGLSGVRRLMDQMEVQSEAGKGTVVTARKWKR